MFEDIVNKPINTDEPKSNMNCSDDCEHCDPMIREQCDRYEWKEVWGLTPSVGKPLGVPGWRQRLEDKIKKYLPNVRTKMED